MPLRQSRLQAGGLAFITRPEARTSAPKGMLRYTAGLCTVTGTPSSLSFLTMTSALLFTSFGRQRGIVENVSTSVQAASTEMASMIGSVTSFFCMPVVSSSRCRDRPSGDDLSSPWPPGARDDPASLVLDAVPTVVHCQDR
jgi:hypothetical protein